MHIREGKGIKAFHCFNVVLMFFLMIIMIYPIIYVALASLSEADKLMAHQGILYRTLGFSLEGYKAVVNNPMIGSGYLNTLFVVVAGDIINITFTAFGAYFLSRQRVFWKNAVMFFIVFTMFFHGGMIPFYLVVKGMGLDNTYWALILPTAISTFNLIIMRTSFQAIPESLIESASIDGANHFVILFRIVLPLSLPVLAVMTLYYTVGHWNSWFNAMIFIRNRDFYPLQLVLREILIMDDTLNMTIGTGFADKESVSGTIKYAVIIVATLPILSIYPFLQKYFVKGVMIGAVKG